MWLSYLKIQSFLENENRKEGLVIVDEQWEWGLAWIEINGATQAELSLVVVGLN